MIKNIIFDIGNVLMGFDADNYGSKFFQDQEQAQLLQQAINSFHLWDKCDLGLQPVEQVIEDFAQTLPGQEAMAKKAIYASVDYVLHADYAIPWLQELHNQGCRTFYLSNYNEYLIGQRPDILDFLDYMDGGIFSCRVHLIKPDPAIYLKLLATYGLMPEECVFLDDRPANIAAAEKLGIQGILVKNYLQARADLQSLLADNI